MNWNYQREESGYSLIPEGPHRVRMESVEEKKSSKGNDMLEIKLAVSGYNSFIWHHITFLPDNPSMANRMLTEIFDSFAIPEGEFSLLNWIGKTGAAVVKHKDGNAKVSYFLKKDKQADLPAWKEGKTDNAGSGATAPGFVQNEPEMDIPF